MEVSSLITTLTVAEFIGFLFWYMFFCCIATLIGTLIGEFIISLFKFLKSKFSKK